ncbi:hypothetical protein AURDEDRAFT_111951, partial [Auricularia subglabra TFB-10046 SS5]
MVEFGLEDDGGYRRTFCAPYVSLSRELSQDFFKRIVSLEVNERDFATWFLGDIASDHLGFWGMIGRVHRRLRFPFIQVLTLFLADLEDRQDGTDDASPFLMTRAETAGTTRLKYLSGLHIAAQETATLAPEMVCELIAHIGCPTPLDVIAFHNVRILENRVDDVAQMLTHARTFEFFSEPLGRMPDMLADMPDIDEDIDFS